MNGRFLILVTLTYFLAGCTDFSGPGGQFSSGDPFDGLELGKGDPTVLEGKWNNCQERSEVRYSSSFFFTGEKFYSVLTLNQDEGCSTPILSIFGAGVFEIHPLIDDAERGEIDTTIEKIQLVPLSQALVESLNSRRACGVNTWTLGNPVYIENTECAGELLQGFTQTTYNIFKVHNKQLYLGRLDPNGKDGTSPEQRPTELEETPLERVD